MIRWRRPTVTASSFECTCSLIMMFWTCVRSVFREMNSRSQMSGGRQPLGEGAAGPQLARRQGSIGGRSGCRSRALATRWAMPMITERGSSVSPARAPRTVATTSSTARSLVR